MGTLVEDVEARLMPLMVPGGDRHTKNADGDEHCAEDPRDI
jgi:hypothetical protein